MNLTSIIEQSYFEYVRSMGIRRQVDAGNLEYIHTGIKLFNRVFNARLEGSFDQTILELVQRFDLWRVPLSWDVSPSTRPADLGQHLERFGFVRRAEVLGMALELKHLKATGAVSAMTVEPVTPANFESWSKVIALANQTPRTRMAMFQKVYEPTLQMPQWKHFLARLEGVPASACSLLSSPQNPQVVGVYWVATVPKARGQGLAGALISQLLQSSPQQMAVLQATPIAQKLYRRLGFEDDLPFTIYSRK